jgi:hypothetical protein
MFCLITTAAGTVPDKKGAAGVGTKVIKTQDTKENTGESDFTYSLQSDVFDSVSTTCLISLWNHRRDLDIKELVEELGVNHVWSHDDNYTGQGWKETHMYKLLEETEVEQVMAKIERAAWGWDHEMSLRHARWVALISKHYPLITGVYLNDFYDEVEDGYRTEEEWREIIAAIKSINPDLQLWVPHYPHREQGRHAFDFDILDATKIWPESKVPLMKVGKMVLNRNPDNFFSETEQVAFHPGHVVPGIDFTNDPLLQGRLFSYLDTQLNRFNSANFHEVPINRPIAPVTNHQGAGFMRMTIGKGKTNYFPNSLGGGCPMTAPENLGGSVHYTEKVEGHKVRERSESFKDHFSQATMFWMGMVPLPDP